MRHKKAGRHFGRTANQRKALLRGIVSSLILHERIETTVAKAKEARMMAEKMITLGKRGDLHAKRVVFSKVPNREVLAKVFSDLGPRFKERNGGYTRIIHSRTRVNDRSEMAVLEFVDYEDRRKAEEGKKKKD